MIDPPKGFTPWHGGLTLMGCLRGVHADQAAWKPAQDRHSIWKLALHIACWKYRMRQYINTENRQKFERSPANWPEMGKQTENRWKADKALVKKEYEQLIIEIEQFPDNKLDEQNTVSKKYTNRQLLDGIATHDTYHIGQIQLMKRLYKSLKS